MFVRFKLEIGGKEILHLVVHIRSVDQSLSLLTMLYGSPALFAIIYLAKLVLHVTPYRTLFNWHGLLVRKDEHLLNVIDSHTTVQKLTCPRAKKTESTRLVRAKSA